MAQSLFSADTVIADAIARDPEIVDRLAEYNPIFRKLKNPALRKIMAKLATFRDAARIAGVPVETILAVAEGRPVQDDGSAAKPISETGPRPSWLNDSLIDGAPRIDARDLLQSGSDPLAGVLQAAKNIPEGALLIVEAPFDPAPLRRVLAKKGFEDHAEAKAPDHWIVFFRRSDAERASTPANDIDPRRWSEDGVLHIDVRGLDPPQPMVEILKLIDSGTAHDLLIVHHEREPVFLYPELAERHWTHEIIDNTSDEVRLRLSKDAS